MNHSDISAAPAPHFAPRPVRRRPALRAAVAAVIAGATLTGLAGCQSSPTSSSFTQVSPTPSVSATSAAPEPSASEPSASKPPAPPGKRADHRPLGEQDGRVPDGVTVFDEHIAAVANLDPALLTALQRAASDARLTFTVNSGWRSADYQEELLRKAVAQYGSEEEAARWVATAQNSPHVSGEAIDLGPSAAQTWLSRHGAAYGLCQIYRNEPWHYELRPQAVTAGCPAMYADPTEDPRMR